MASYRCESCGHQSGKWMGFCPQCGNQDPLTEIGDRVAQKAKPAQSVSLPSAIHYRMDNLP